MPKDNESEALDSLMGDAEQEDAKAFLAPPAPVSVTVIVNAGGAHIEPDGDEGELGKLTEG